jgi:serine protease
MSIVRSCSLATPFLLVACATAGGPETTDNTPSTFEEFEAATYKEPWEGGLYIVDGDTPVTDRKALRELWEQRFAGSALIVHAPGGVDARWNETDKRALTYCVSDAFGANKPAVLDAMRRATDEGWETFADVDFVHVTAEDANCTANNNNVLFDIRPVSGQPYLARAFFPNQTRSTRNVLVDSTAFDTIWPLENIMGHELGHALGFRHEHTRPEAGTCFEDSQWRPLTEYDSASVMHYPQCNGTSNDLAFTAIDAAGAAVLYGPPGGEPPPPPPPGDGEQHETGVLAAGEWLDFAPIAVEPGTRFEAVLTGTGDPDLYVRFDDLPTKSLFDCRPYVEGPDEQCALDVPADVAVAYVSLHGFAAAEYDLTLRWSQGDPGGGAAELMINEILADASVLDSNYDGVVDPVADEMLEIVNIGDGAADLSGAMIADAVGVRVVLPAGTTLAPREALVVYGGGTAPDLGPAVRVVVGRLYLNNTADTITMRDPGGAVLATASYGGEANHDMSITRATELDPTAAFVQHTSVSAYWASPGLRADGTPF